MNREELIGALKQLRLPTMAEQFSELAKQAESSHLTFEKFLASLVASELEAKLHLKVTRLTKDAKLPQIKEISAFDFNCRQGITRQQVQRLATGEWVKKAWNVVLYGGFGVGKSHLAMALARDLCTFGYRCYFTSTSELIDGLLRASSSLTLSSHLKSLDRYDLIILDELGYTPHTKDGADLFFQFISQRYERKSLLITTNLTYSEWDQVFINQAMTQAAVDRIIHRCETFNIQGPSWRAEEAKTRSRKAKAKMGEDGLAGV